jgi:hypothetical protein
MLSRYFGTWRPGDVNYSFMCDARLSFHLLTFCTARQKGCGLCSELGQYVLPMEWFAGIYGGASDLRSCRPNNGYVRDEFRLIGTRIPRLGTWRATILAPKLFCLPAAVPRRKIGERSGVREGSPGSSGCGRAIERSHCGQWLAFHRVARGRLPQSDASLGTMCVSEPKWDGFRCILTRDGDEVACSPNPAKT